MNIGGKMPGAGPGKKIVKPRNLWVTMKRLLGYMKKSSGLVAAAVIVVAAGTLLQVISPKMLGNATTLIFDGITGGSSSGIDQLTRLLLLTAAVHLGIGVTSFVQQRIMVVVSQKTTFALRNDLKQKMNRLPISYFDKHTNGNLMSIGINDIDNIVTNLQQSLTSLISSLILVVGIFCIMLLVSPLLTLAACLMIPGSLLIMKLLTPFTQKNNQAYVAAQGDLNTKIEEAYQGFTILKSFGREENTLAVFDQTNKSMYRSGWKAKFFGGMMMPLMILAQNIIYVLIAVAGSLKIISGTMRIGDLQAFLQYSVQFASPLAHFSQVWNGLLTAAASAERVFEVLDAEEMEAPAGEELKRDSVEKVCFSHVCFGYGEEPLFRDFNLKVKEGSVTAIVGHTGAGKSTLIHLLERFYEPSGGSIRIDGQDIRSLDYGTLRKRIGMVLQDTWLFSGTIYENIRFGNELASEGQVYAAAEAAFADDFIRKLPDGYQTVLDEEAGNISQGQRQLLTIARAFLADPEILILDEATSNVDSRTELVIQKAMRKLQQGRTTFVVAHRLSTIYDADTIVVMNQGDIAETGTHPQLLARGGVYADIYNSQFMLKNVS